VTAERKRSLLQQRRRQRRRRNLQGEFFNSKRAAGAKSTLRPAIDDVSPKGQRGCDDSKGIQQAEGRVLEEGSNEEEKVEPGSSFVQQPVEAAEAAVVVVSVPPPVALRRFQQDNAPDLALYGNRLRLAEACAVKYQSF
jgi:hypothetical protein